MRVWGIVGWSFIRKRQKLSIARMKTAKGITLLRNLIFWVTLFDPDYQGIEGENSL